MDNKINLKHIPNYVSTEDIISRVNFEDIESIPRIIISIAPVRSGTTATLRLFSESGIQSHRQPFKSIYRHLAQGKPGLAPEWILPSGKTIYVKETLGPHNVNEALINPIELFFQIFKVNMADQFEGVELTLKVLETMQSKIHLIIMGRDPVESWSSNLATHNKLVEKGELGDNHYYSASPSDLLQNFIVAYQQVEKIKESAKNLNIPISHYVYEANKIAEKAIPKLFNNLKIQSDPVISGWNNQSSLDSNKSNIHIISDYENQQKAQLHTSLDKSDGIHYFQRNTDSVPKNIKKIIKDCGLNQIHDDWKKQTEIELGITLSKKNNSE